MTNNNRKKEGAYEQLTGFRRAVPIILAALAVFTALCFIMQDTGALGRVISKVFLGLFSVGGYFIPAFLVVHAVFYPSDVLKKRTVSRIIFTLIALVTVSMLIHSVSYIGEELTFSPSELYTNGTQLVGGGFIGGAFAFVLTKIFGTVGIIIISVLVFALYLTYFFAGGRATLSRLLLKILNGLSYLFTAIATSVKRGRAKRARRREERYREERDAELELLLDDEFISADNGMKELKVEELGILEVKNDADLERNPKLQEKILKTEETEPKKEPEEKYQTVYEEAEPRKRTYNMDYSTTDSLHGLSVSVDETVYEPKSDDIIYDDLYKSGEESADELFDKRDFEPFDIKLNEELAAKPSSRAAARESAESGEGIGEFAEPLTEVSEEEVRRARERADFEMKKKAAFEAQKRYAEAQAEIERARRAAMAAEAESAKATYEPEAQREAYIPEYMRAAENVEPEQKKCEEPDYTERFAQAMNDYEEEKKTFRPYTPPTAESFIPASDSAEEKHESAEELKITRTMLDPTPTDEEDEEEYTEFDAAEEPEEDEAEDEPIPPEEQNADVIMQRGMFPFLDREEKAEPPVQSDGTGVEFEAMAEDFDSFAAQESDGLTEEELAEEDEAEDEPPFEYTPPTRQAVQPKREPAPKEPEPEPVQEKPDYSDYLFPPVDLLKKGSAEDDLNQEEEKNQNAEKLVDSLLQFNVRVSIKGIYRGPRITRYEIVPAHGVKVSSVTNLFNDIALYLGVEGMRMEAPVPGKSAIGVEIPNKHPSTVLLRDLVDDDTFKLAESKTFSCLGKDVTGTAVFADIAKMPHVLIAGATGMGKSVCINSILISILYKARPDEVKFIMIDPKKVEFNGYNGIPHLLIPVVTDVKQAAGALMWAVEQMEKRYELMEKLEVRKLDSYNERVREDPSLGEPLPKIIIVIDELNDIMLQVRKPAEGLIMSIAQKARAAGIHLIIGTQRPSVDVITGVIKANIPSRISCKVASYNDSKTILEQAGAEKLLNNGDMLYISAGAPKACRVQGAFVSDGEVASVMKFLKAQAKGSIYDAQALEEINRAAQKCAKGKGGDDLDDDGDGEDTGGLLNDQQFLDAVDAALKAGKISTSFLQRKISIGYGKAAKFIDAMEDLGIVSEPNGQKPRDVLMTADEWHEILSRRSLD